MADTEAPPPRETWRDPRARVQGWQLLLPPLVFLAHFGAVYGWAGLVCAFGLGQRGEPWLSGGMLLATVLALALLWWRRAGRVPPAPQERLRAYDPEERSHFMVTVTRMVTWLAVAGMLAVAAMRFVAGGCAMAP